MKGRDQSYLVSHQSPHLNLSTYNLLLGQDKEISMQDPSLADCLLLLRNRLQQEGISNQVLLTVDQIDVRIHQLLHHNASLQLTLANLTLQHTEATKKLKKNNSKLNKKTLECQNIAQELTRVNGIYSQKLEKLVHQTDHWIEKEDDDQVRLKEREKKKMRISTGTHCQILKESLFEEQQNQNLLLKGRLEQTQKQLLDEKQENATLRARVKELTTLSEELFKDNSTIDADSTKGDHFQFDQDLEEGEMMPISEVQQEEEQGRGGWLRKIWVSTMNIYGRLTARE